jgi:hypothetical protein
LVGFLQLPLAVCRDRRWQSGRRHVAVQIGKGSVRIAVVGALAGAVIALTGSPSLAATGTVTVSSPDGQQIILRNPAEGCYSASKQLPAGTRVQNGTNVYIVLYPGVGCTGLISIAVSPGSSASFALGSLRVLP